VKKPKLISDENIEESRQKHNEKDVANLYLAIGAANPFKLTRLSYRIKR
jgi:hypothetical protein